MFIAPSKPVYVYVSTPWQLLLLIYFMLVSLQFMLTVTLYKIVDHARLLLKLTVSACMLESQTLLSLSLPPTRSACAENEACQTI